MLFGPSDKPEIDYPGPWAYTVFGTSEERLRLAVAVAVGGLEHTLEPSKRSSSGKFVSMHVEVQVADEAQRLAIGKALTEQADIGFVL